LRQHGIDFFEIPGSLLWGGGAICVQRSEDFAAARTVIEEFQQQWRANVDHDSTPPRMRLILAIPVFVILLFFVLATLISIL